MSNKTQDHHNAMWAASKIQARFRGRKTRFITSNKKLAVLKSRTGLGLMVMSRIAEFATSTSTSFIKQLEEEASGHHAATVLSEATGDDKNRANNIGDLSSILDGKTLGEIKKEKEDLVGFEMDDDCFNAVAEELTLDDSTATKMNLFVTEYPIYPKLIVSFEAHRNSDANEGIVVQRSWVEVPPKNKPMRYLRVRQDQLDDAQRIVVRHSKGDMKKDNDQMSEGGFSSASSFGDSDDLNSLYSDEDDDKDLELSTNLHDLM